MRKLYYNWSNKLDIILTMAIFNSAVGYLILDYICSPQFKEAYMSKPELGFLYMIPPLSALLFVFVLSYFLSRRMVNDSTGFIFSLFKDACLKDGDVVLIKKPKSRKLYSGKTIINEGKSAPTGHTFVTLFNQEQVCIPNYSIKRIFDNEITDRG